MSDYKRSERRIDKHGGVKRESRRCREQREKPLQPRSYSEPDPREPKEPNKGDTRQ